jgi:hypothetical protein
MQADKSIPTRVAAMQSDGMTALVFFFSNGTHIGIKMPLEIAQDMADAFTAHMTPLHLEGASDAA